MAYAGKREEAAAHGGGRRGWPGRLARALAATLACLPALAAAQAGAGQGEEVRVAATFTVLADLAEAVAGERAEVQSVTPVGAEVHEWELKPRDFRILAEADVVLYNGYNLEQWMDQVRATVDDDVPVIPVAEESGYATRPIQSGDLAGDPDPHLWLDPRAAAAYVEVIREALSDQDPAGAEAYAANAADYREALTALHEEIAATLAALPEASRFLVTTEAAFPYFAAAYGLEHDGIWGTNTERGGSPRQIMRIVDRVRERDPGAVFWESTVPERYVRSVAEGTGLAVAGPLYVDSLSGPEGPAADYLSLMRHNAETIARALGAD